MCQQVLIQEFVSYRCKTSNGNVISIVVVWLLHCIKTVNRCNTWPCSDFNVWVVANYASAYQLCAFYRHKYEHNAAVIKLAEDGCTRFARKNKYENIEMDKGDCEDQDSGKHKWGRSDTEMVIKFRRKDKNQRERCNDEKIEVSGHRKIGRQKQMWGDIRQKDTLEKNNKVHSEITSIWNMHFNTLVN